MKITFKKEIPKVKQIGITPITCHNSSVESLPTDFLTFSFLLFFVLFSELLSFSELSSIVCPNSCIQAPSFFDSHFGIIGFHLFNFSISFCCVTVIP